MTDMTVVLFIIGETILVVGSVLIAWVKTKSQIAVLEALVAGLKADHVKLEKQIDGISRHLSELTGYMKAKQK
jgi:sensor domain CHASE-containing protein